MANAAGQAYCLSVLTPVLPARESALCAYLEQLPKGDQGPFWKVGTTHFVRWVVIHQLVYEGPPQVRDTLGTPCLLFTAVFDGALDAYLDLLCSTLGTELDAVWGQCVGSPGTRDVQQFKAYLRHNQIDATFFYAAYPDASLRKVLEALDLRQRFTEFAIAAQALEPAERLQAFRTSFPSLARAH